MRWLLRSLLLFEATGSASSTEHVEKSKPFTCLEWVSSKLGLNHSTERVDNSVNWLKTWMTLALVVLWPLVTSRCKLEFVPGFSFLVCSSQDDAASHQDDDCKQIESGLYKLKNTPVAATAPSLLVDLFLTASVEPLAQSLAAFPLLHRPSARAPGSSDFGRLFRLAPLL